MPESLGGINDLKGENHTILLPKEACAKSNPPLRHSREGGNPDCMLMLLFPPKRKSTALDSRLRGNDGGGGG